MTSLINMTSEQRIQYRRDNWRGKTFGNVENMHTKVSEKEIFMEMVSNDLSKTLKKIEENKPKTKTSKKKRKPKYNWTKLNDVFDDVYTVCHRKYNKDGEPCIDFHWQDVQGFVNEYFELIKSDEKMINYIKLKQERYTELTGKEIKESDYELPKEKSKEYKPDFLKNMEKKINKSNLIVFNIPLNTTKDQLYAYFSKFGGIKNINLMTDKRTGKFRGFGFVNTYYDSTGEKIIENCNGRPFGPCILKIQYADKDKKKK